METAASALDHRNLYKLLTGCIVPRPIAWVSTIDADGRPNLAPFSFFAPVCSNPPTVLFCPSVRAADLDQKDTLHNVRATGVFIINIVTEALAEAMNLTSAEVPPHVNEFERAGLTPVPGVAVPVPRVAESPIHFECRLQQIIPISAEPGGGNIVIGTVVHIHCAESVWREGHHIDTLALQPIGRLAGAAYSRTHDLFSLQRPASEITPKTIP